MSSGFLIGEVGLTSRKCDMGRRWARGEERGGREGDGQQGKRWAAREEMGISRGDGQ